MCFFFVTNFLLFPKIFSELVFAIHGSRISMLVKKEKSFYNSFFWLSSMILPEKKNQTWPVF